MITKVSFSLSAVATPLLPFLKRQSHDMAFFYTSHAAQFTKKFSTAFRFNL
jgi:hypothetical protein